MKLVENLGESYEVTRTNIKKWTVGSPIQAPLDALELILKKHSFAVDQVQNVTVRVGTQEAVIVNNREMPDICLQHMVAVMLIDRTVSFRSAHDKARMQDGAVVRLRAKVNLVPDENLDRLLPRRIAIVEVTVTGGKTLSQRVDDVRGTAENPMTRDEVVAKCRDLINPVLGISRCAKLIDMVLGLENVKDMRELRPLLQRVEP
jgi:2-methylcitrate dehydratase PrpD